MNEELKNGGWEYAPMFNMKFHADERSMDMTRRRRWHRKMVPSAEENLFTTASGIAVANTDIVFRVQSQVTPTSETSNKIDQGPGTSETSETSSTSTTTKEKEIKIELNAPRMFLTFKS